MPLTLRDNLPFTTVTVAYQGIPMDVPFVPVDTGSAATLPAADIVAAIGIVPLPQDPLHTIRGVGVPTSSSPVALTMYRWTSAD
jgi:hypothetical protein